MCTIQQKPLMVLIASYDCMWYKGMYTVCISKEMISTTRHFDTIIKPNALRWYGFTEIYLTLRRFLCFGGELDPL